ncbi:MAG: hypothetical protein WD490_03490, partial [Opitutales bacterium]
VSFENGGELQKSGLLADSGFVLGNFTSNGRVRLREESLYVAGDFKQTDSGWLDLSLGEPGAKFLNILGAAAFQGGLRVDFVPDYLPQLGDSWVLLAAEELELDLNEMILPLPRNGLAWQLRRTTEGIVLETVDQPEIEFLGEMVLNRQTGLFEQVARVRNSGLVRLDAVRLLVRDLPASAVLYNAGSRLNGDYLVQWDQALAPGESVEFKLEYYFPDRQPRPDVILIPDAAFSTARQAPKGRILEIDRWLQLDDGAFLVEFSTRQGALYFIQYSTDLATWKTAQPSLTGNGSRIQWLDSGPPKTESLPSAERGRFYRLIEIESGSAPASVQESVSGP